MKEVSSYRSAVYSKHDMLANSLLKTAN